MSNGLERLSVAGGYGHPQLTDWKTDWTGQLSGWREERGPNLFEVQPTHLQIPNDAPVLRVDDRQSRYIDLPTPDSLKDWPGPLTTELILAATVVEQAEQIRNLTQRLEALENGQG